MDEKEKSQKIRKIFHGHLTKNFKVNIDFEIPKTKKRKNQRNTVETELPNWEALTISDLINIKKINPSELKASKNLLEKIKSRRNYRHYNQKNQGVKELKEFFKILITETKILKHLPILGYNVRDKSELTKKVEGLYEQMVKRPQDIVRPLAEFNSRSHNPHRQLAALCSHLFEKYSTPQFLQNSLDNKDPEQFELYIHVAQGSNIRSFPKGALSLQSMPELTKTQAHLFHTILAQDTPIGDGFLIVQVMDIIPETNTETLGQIVELGKQYQQNIVRNQSNSFFQETCHLIKRAGMIDSHQIRPLGDYLIQMKRQNPDYTLKGRSPTVLLKSMENWHNILQRSKTSKNRRWTGQTDIEPLYHPSKENPTWRIEEITTEKGLMEEGKVMKHCAYSYTHACMEGKLSIWSAKTFNESNQTWKCDTTIEIKGQEVTQARGKCNMTITPLARSILHEWCRQNKLKVSNYL